MFFLFIKDIGNKLKNARRELDVFSHTWARKSNYMELYW